MNNEISVCGTDCKACSYLVTCGGCSHNKGKVFHCADGEACAIYRCCVTLHGFPDCSQCGLLPCDIWRKTRDPRFSDDEFEENIAGRVAALRGKD